VCCWWELGHFSDVCRVFIVMSRVFVSMGRQVGAGGCRLRGQFRVPRGSEVSRFGIELLSQ